LGEPAVINYETNDMKLLQLVLFSQEQLRPIVTANVPGCKEIVRHGENGFLVPVKDSKALANALLTLLSDKALRQTMGSKGRALVEQDFSLEKTVALTFDMYRKLIG
jgi:glycosyltransferase involved in cell wall biosynthesis